MISAKELNPHNYSKTPEVQKNLDKLLDIMNQIRIAYGKPMIITSGLRSEADQARINPSAPKSKHLLGLACDVADTDGEVYKWCMNNEELLKNTGVWLENRRGNWQHFQIAPFGSWNLGKSIWFNP